MSAPALAVSAELRTARLKGMLAWLDAGGGNARIRIMGGAWPGAGVDGGTELAAIELDKPCGKVEGGSLVLASSGAANNLVAASGEALWARMVTAAGHWAFDCAVAPKGADKGGLQIEGAATGPADGVLLYKGGKLPVVSLRLT